MYIDTSWLMWLLQIGRAARREFLEVWNKEQVTSQAFVPVWAVHELYQHLQKRTVWHQTQQSTTLYLATLRAIVEHADIVGDDSLCRTSRFVSKTDLVESLRHSATAVNECVSALQMDDELYAEAVADITKFVNQHSLSSNIFDILKVDQGAKEVRFEGRLPPGYKDDSKLENSFGDLVFWTEILRDAPSGATVVVLTRDEKTDWQHLECPIFCAVG